MNSHCRNERFAVNWDYKKKKDMSVIEAKKEEITQILDEMPETFLDTLLAYLKEMKGETSEDEALMQHFERVLEKDYNLFKRLAQ
jgi:hypothetical protein